MQTIHHIPAQGLSYRRSRSHTEHVLANKVRGRSTEVSVQPLRQQSLSQRKQKDRGRHLECKKAKQRKKTSTTVNFSLETDQFLTRPNCLLGSTSKMGEQQKSIIVRAAKYAFAGQPRGPTPSPPEGVLPNSRLMGMRRWMGSHLHHGIDYYGVAFLRELLEWGRTFSVFWGSENSGRQGFKNRKIYTTLSLTNVSVHFRMTKLKGFIRQMHKQKVTKLGLPKLLFSQSN